MAAHHNNVSAAEALAAELLQVLQTSDQPLVAPSELTAALLRGEAWQGYLAPFQPGRGQAAAIGRFLRSLGLHSDHDRSRGSVYSRMAICNLLTGVEPAAAAPAFAPAASASLSVVPTESQEVPVTEVSPFHADIHEATTEPVHEASEAEYTSPSESEGEPVQEPGREAAYASLSEVEPVQEPARETADAAPSEAEAEIAGLVYGMAPVRLEANGGESGLPVEFRVLSGPAEITDGVLTVTGAGTVVIEASQAGNENYEAAAPIQLSYLVARAPLEIRADDITIVYGDALPALQARCAGFVRDDNEQTALGGPILLKTEPAAPRSAGEYAIVPAAPLEFANYAIHFQPGHLRIARAPQVIEFAPLPDSTYGGEPLELKARGGGSAQAVTFAVSGPAEVRDGRLWITGAGEVVVEARQEGDANHEPAAPVRQRCSVRRALLTVTAPSASLRYGDALPALTPTISGFVNGDDASTALVGAPALSTSPSPAGRAGRYTVQVAQGTLRARNYEFEFVAGVLTIEPVEQAIDFPPPPSHVIYGVLPLRLQARGGGSSAAVEYVVLAGPATVNGGQLAITGAGTITVEARQAGDDNYLPALPVRHSLTVDKAVLTVTAKSLTVPFGAPVPPYSASFEGFVNSDDESVLAGAPTLSTVPEEPRAVGQYPIVAALGTLHSANYGFRLVDGTLTITKARQTIQFERLENTVYGHEPVPLRGQAKAAGPVRFRVLSGPGRVREDMLVIEGAGLITVEATHQGDDCYLAAPPVRQALSAAKPTLTVTAESMSLVYGEGLRLTAAEPERAMAVAAGGTGGAAAPARAAAASGFRVHGAVVTLAGANQTAATGGGGRSWRQRFGAGMTAATPATVTVRQAPMPAFGFRVEGLVNGDQADSALTGRPSLVTEPPFPVAAGEYTIHCGLGTLRAPHYDLIFRPGKLTIARAPQTIQWPPLPALRYGTLPIALRAQGGGSGEPVVFRVTAGPASVHEGRLHIQGAGTVVVEATQAGNANYLAATPVSQTLEVAKAVLTVRANDVTAVHGEPLELAGVTFHGLVAGDLPATAVRGQAAVSVPMAARAAGTYLIETAAGTLESDHYEFVFEPGVLTVVPAPQQIDFALPSALDFGVPPLQLQAQGGNSGQPVVFALVGGPARLQGATLTFTGAGVVEVEARQEGDANHLPAAPVRCRVEVRKACLRVSARPVRVVYGEAVPEYEYTLDGFVNGDSRARIRGAAEVHSTPPRPTLAGRYPIVPSAGTLEAENYAFEFVPAELTIAPAPQSIEFHAPPTLQYGAAPCLLQARGGASGQPVTFTVVAGPAHVRDGRLHLDGAGRVRIRAQQAGDQNFLPADAVEDELLVEKARLTLTAGSVVTIYGEPLPPFGYTLAGWVGDDSAATRVQGAPQLTLAPAGAPAAGQYRIHAELGTLRSDDYEFALTDGLLTIARAPQRLGLRLPATLIYGMAPVRLQAEAGASGEPVQYRVVSGPARVQDGRLELRGAGTVIIEACQAGTANYLPAGPITVSAEVQPAVLTVTAASTQCVFGQPLPPLRTRITGWVGDDEARGAVSGQPSVEVQPEPTGAGTYTLVASRGTLAAADYTFVFVPGQLTIARAAQAIRLGPVLVAPKRQPATSTTAQRAEEPPAAEAARAPRRAEATAPAAAEAAKTMAAAAGAGAGAMVEAMEPSATAPAPGLSTAPVNAMESAVGESRAVPEATAVETAATAAAAEAELERTLRAQIPTGKFAHLSDGSVWTKDADGRLRRVPAERPDNAEPQNEQEPAALPEEIAARIPVGKFAHLSDGSVWTRDERNHVRRVQ